MTEEKSKQALFQIHEEYMKHSPEERVVLYEDYQKKRNEVKHELLEYVSKKNQNA